MKCKCGFIDAMSHLEKLYMFCVNKWGKEKGEQLFGEIVSLNIGWKIAEMVVDKMDAKVIVKCKEVKGT